ncbi:MAG: hypothetical protein WB992_12705 [Bryobacteraceae bacterium]
MPLICHCEEACPWLNAGTAAGVLGGAVKTSVTHDKNKDDGVCEFIREQDSAAAALRIEVRTMLAPKAEFPSFAARCGAAPAPIKAIGNEAVACKLDGTNGAFTAQIVSRVRDRAFLVSVTTNDRSIAKPALEGKCRSVAEQVAGALF